MAILKVPGRTELAGNHTDHQHGRVLASAIHLNVQADYTANSDSIVRINSEGYDSITVKTSQLSVRPAEFGKPVSLVRGVLSAFQDLGLRIGGFDATVSSSLPIGAGLSSSAAFSVLIARILCQLYNGGEVEDIVIARTAHRAEKDHFGKPSGLTSQLVCAIGHTLYVDLKTNEIERIVDDFSDMGLTMCLTDTGGTHDGLNTSYARIPADMCYIANLFDVGILADVDPEAFRSKGWDLSNRPVRRAMHFFNENERVPLMRDALKAHNGEEYMRLMNESGRSSEELLNNIVTSATGDTRLLEGLERSAALLDGKGAWRVHGGGFAGCVQALMPSDYFPVYKEKMEITFGKGSCFAIHLV
ncbi:MAG: galactokinase [Oscillospiraceae bacterium]|nr:galactokinase [Oscillospiraceae bacterium]